MQLKNSRGVQQHDVWTAADALIAEGLRPTIERVRQKIGRGSPNTVSPMLEAWFATLAPRLGVSRDEAGSDRLPAPVLELADSLWRAALEAAREASARALEQERLALDVARAELRDAASDIGIRERALIEKQASMDEALAFAKNQNADLTARLSGAQALAASKDAEIGELRVRLAAVEKEQGVARRQYEVEATRLAEERRQMQERADATERRLLQDVDRARQETRQLKSALSDAERRAAIQRQELDTMNKTLEAKLQLAQTELGSLRQTAVAAEERSAELRILLDRQHAASQIALNRLSSVTAPGAKLKFSRRLKIQPR